MEKRLYGIRGAVFADANTKDEILKAVDMLFARLFSENHIIPHDIVSIQFTITKDLTAFNPATALRKSSQADKVSTCALYCSQEPDIDGASELTIRTLITAYLPEGTEPRYVFTNGAEALRPDLAQKK
jgi:chorismate mutase